LQRAPGVSPDISPHVPCAGSYLNIAARYKWHCLEMERSFQGIAALQHGGGQEKGKEDSKGKEGKLEKGVP